MALPLEGKVAMITGSSRGIGKAIALALAQDGCDIAVCARSEQSTDLLPGSIGETAAAIEALGRRAIAIRMDVANDDDLRAGAERALSELGRVDILVNNAALLGGAGQGPFLEMGVENLDNAYRINTRAPYLLTHLVAPNMVANGGGLIVNISSAAANLPKPPTAPMARSGFYAGVIYGTTKAALDRWATGIALELYENNISVVEINPGFTITERLERNPRPGMDMTRGERPETTGKAVAYIARDPMAFTGKIITSRELVDEKGL